MANNERRRVFRFGLQLRNFWNFINFNRRRRENRQRNRLLQEPIRQERLQLAILREILFDEDELNLPLGLWNGQEAGQLIPVPVEPEPVAPQRRYPVGSGFPIIMECRFHHGQHQPHEEFASHGDLQWIIKWTIQEKNAGTLFGSATMFFNGLGDKAYKISATCSSSENPVRDDPDDTIVIDKAHYQVVFPDIMKLRAESGTNRQFIAPEIIVTITVHNIELVDGGVIHEQRWPSGTSWITYDDLLSVRMDQCTLEKVSICFPRFMEDLTARLLSVEEAQAFYDFACLLFHNSFYGEEKYQKVLVNGFKFGFVNYKFQDLPDTPLDFNSRTMLPHYQILSVETPVEHVSRDGIVNGSCDHFKLKLDRDIQHLRSQVEKMPNFRGGHRGQVSFYLEETAQGTLLIAAVNMLLIVPKLAKMKIALFENEHAVQHHETYRVVDSDQRTICIPVCVLTEQQISMMAGGQMAVNVQLYLFPAEQHATHINNINSLEDGTVAHVMPGVINGWIRCEDGKLVGVCKEHVAHFCGWLSMMFFNQNFSDCGKNIVDVAAPTEVVLDALQVIYHRCHAVLFDRVDLVLELAGFWASPFIRYYFDVAVWKSPLMLIEDKVRLARKYDLEITTYVLRHPQYHNIKITAELMAELTSDA